MPSAIQQSTAKVVLPRTSTVRNIFTKLDDIGLFSSLRRSEGEDLAGFKVRLYANRRRPGDATLNGFIDSISTEFNLKHIAAMNVASENTDLYIDVRPGEIYVSGINISTTINTIDVDANNYWTLKTMGHVISGFNELGGVTATMLISGWDSQPAILLEEQSSYVTIYNERAPVTNSWTLGQFSTGLPIDGTVIDSTVNPSFSPAYAIQMSGIPNAIGEWSVDPTSNTIRTHTIPRDPVSVSYTYNVLVSGSSMDLIANETAIMSLADTDVQSLLFTPSGIQGQASEYIQDIRLNAHKLYWGK